MTTNGIEVDGLWDIRVLVTDLDMPKILTVKGDLHIGGVMFKLVNSIDVQADWSGHGLWWPSKNQWLLRSRSTLDQYGVQAGAELWFTPMCQNISVHLPDLQISDMRVDCSCDVFRAVIKVCKELGIRHPEELSFCRKLSRDELKRNRYDRQAQMAHYTPLRAPGTRAPSPHSPVHHHYMANSSGSGGGSHDGTMISSPRRSPLTPATPQGTMLRTPATPNHSPYAFNAASHSPYQYGNGTLSPGSMHSLSLECLDASLANSPVTPTREALSMLYRPKSYAEKARINAGWFDSSRSLMEQGIRENDAILLRFKYFQFYDLNPKYDTVRINQIYEQSKWSLIGEEIDCTDEEMMMFAALQLQIQHQSTQPHNDTHNNHNGTGEDDIDAALTDLQVSLEGSMISSTGDITHIPELQDTLRFLRPKKFALKNYKRHYFVFKDTYLTMFRSSRDQRDPLMSVSLRGCEVTPDVSIGDKRFNIKLFIPSADGMTEVWVRADMEEQYAKWMAACRLAAKGKTMADSSYDSEVQSILEFLRLQQPAPAAAVSTNEFHFSSEDYVAPRFMKKFKSKQLMTRILEAHANVRDMTLSEAKMAYIRAWQALPDHGLTYFIVRFKKKGDKKESKKDELVGIAHNRMIRMELSSGDSIQTWRFHNMKTWSVNWEIKQLQVAFENDDVSFECKTADCKVVHEYIGGYVFLSMRSGDKNQSLNEELFHKLTGGWV